MVLDASALIAILFDEPTAEPLEARVLSGLPAVIGSPTLFEARMVAARGFGSRAQFAVDEALKRLRVSIVPFTAEHARVAGEAFERFGKGRHPASLNFGDCMAYAIAKYAGQPLLFTGDDFSKTDVATA